MAFCHTCDFAKKIHGGDYADVPWESTPCASCKMKEDSRNTREYSDSHPGAATAAVAPPSPEDDISLPVGVLADSLRLFLNLPGDALDVLRLRYSGQSYKEIASRLGVTTAAAEIRHKRLMSEIPSLRALYPAKARKASARRRRRGLARKQAG